MANVKYDDIPTWGSAHLTPPGFSLPPGTVLVDDSGGMWMVKDDGKTATGTNGCVMVDITRGRVIFNPTEV